MNKLVSLLKQTFLAITFTFEYLISYLAKTLFPSFFPIFSYFIYFIRLLYNRPKLPCVEGESCMTCQKFYVWWSLISLCVSPLHSPFSLNMSITKALPRRPTLFHSQTQFLHLDEQCREKVTACWKNISAFFP